MAVDSERANLPVFYLNGEWLPFAEARVSVLDAVCHGDSVYDTLRTVNRSTIFRVDDHLERLYASCRAAQIEPAVERGELGRILHEAVDRNVHLLEENDDAWLLPRISSGSLIAPGPAHTLVAFIPLPFTLNARFFKLGTHLIVPTIRNVPPQCMDPKVKSDSRLFMHIAEREVKRLDPDAKPLMLDVHGNVTELTDASFFIVKKGEVVTAPTRNVLPGVSRQVVLELCERLGVPAAERDFQLYDVYNADEAFQTGTSYRMLPVSRVNHRHLWMDVPGPVTARILEAYGEEMGLDIAEQFLSHLDEAERRALDDRTGALQRPAVADR
jgi:branched-subunit amino acid aminotransferase/4-amino-4-deoxychorismate lyase